MSVPVKTSYVSLPVDIPESFLAPLENPSVIEVSPIDFEHSVLPEYKGLYAVILDNVMSPKECDHLIRLAEMSAGGHIGNLEVPNDGWRPAMVNVGDNYEMLVEDYRNSDRIIWDEKDVARRLWTRVLQGKGIKEYLLRLEGKTHAAALSRTAQEAWISTEQGMNERMRFLKYGAGQYFRGKCYPRDLRCDY